MNRIQLSVLFLLGMFYVTYFAKALMLKRQGVTVNLLGKGDKPNTARNIELFLRAVTWAGAVVQFGSVLFPSVVSSLPVNMPVRITGAVLLLIGDIFFIAAVFTMRENWRAGFNRNQKTSLVTNGIYQFSRNPAFVGFDLLYMGCAAAFPNIINIIITVIAILLFHVQILGEEKYLAESFGQEYKDYQATTRRYLGKCHLHRSL